MLFPFQPDFNFKIRKKRDISTVRMLIMDLGVLIEGFLIGRQKVERAFPLLLKLPQGHRSSTSQLGQPCLSLVSSAADADPEY